MAAIGYWLGSSFEMVFGAKIVMPAMLAGMSSGLKEVNTKGLADLVLLPASLPAAIAVRLSDKKYTFRDSSLEPA